MKTENRTTNLFVFVSFKLAFLDWNFLRGIQLVVMKSLKSGFENYAKSRKFSVTKY